MPGSTREFQYCGAIAPVQLGETARDSILAIGDALTTRFALRGVFGVDLIIDGEKTWTIEVNPRLPSSAEVVERAAGINVVAAHEKACNSSDLPIEAVKYSERCFGKAILFARERLFIARSLQLSQSDLNDDDQCPAQADVPRISARTERTHPIVTILADAVSADEVAACLKARVAIVEKQLYA